MGFDAEALNSIMRHTWPGNVRELENAVERAVLMAKGQRITASDLQFERSPFGRDGATGAVVRIPPAGVALKEIERMALVEALKMTNWVQKDAAVLLSISPRVISYRMKILRIRAAGAPAAKRGAPPLVHLQGRASERRHDDRLRGAGPVVLRCHDIRAG